jgi:2,4-dienoyl-CoA reductase (NADPH2)
LYRLATQGTKEIVLVEMIDRVGKDIGKSTRWGMMQALASTGVETRVATKALEITDSGLRVDAAGGVEEIVADSIVLGVGSASYNPLADFLADSEIPHQVVGDAAKVATAFEAVHQGFAAGRKI